MNFLLRNLILIVIPNLVIGLMVVGCSQPRSVPTPTRFAQPTSAPILIELKIGKFDPLVNVPKIPEDLTFSEYPSEEGYYIIQFDGPILEEWQHSLDATGAKRINYVPNFAYLARMTSEQKEKAEALPHLRWIGLYQPGYKISPDLSGNEPGQARLIVLTFPGTDFEAIKASILLWGGAIEDASENQYSGTILTGLDRKNINKLARLPGVMWIEPWSEPVLH